MASLQEHYRERIKAGNLREDSAQVAALNVLQNLTDRLDGYSPKRAGWFGKYTGKKIVRPQGLYIHGEVGRGKSMLMDLFFQSVNVSRKRRVHFHQFMLEAHDRLHRYRKVGEGGALPRLAREISDETWLLCFDEFHVGNIADAMILGRLFAALFEAGVVVVATSNWPPDQLYKGGLQRDRFLPFIDLMKRRMDVHNLAGAVDHRYEYQRSHACYFSPLCDESSRRLSGVFADLTAGIAPESLELPVQGRSVSVPLAANGVALFTFSELCEKPLGAADYLAIAECFPVVLIGGVPIITPERRNEAARFITLIDALYESRAQLFMAAEAAPDKLCPAGEQAFAFQRAASRLAEMQGETYRQLPHLG